MVTLMSTGWLDRLVKFVIEDELSSKYWPDTSIVSHSTNASS